MKITVLKAVFVFILASASPAICQQASLRAGIDGTFAPHAMPNVKGVLVGFNVDLVEALGKQLGVKIQVDNVQFSGLVPGLQSGVYDFIAAPVTVNKERADSLLFSEGYINTDFQFAIMKNTPDIKSVDELKGKNIAVNKGSTYDQWARGQADKVGWNVESYSTTVDAVQAVLTGRAHAILLGNTSAAWMVKNNPAMKLSLVNSTGLVFAFPVRKDNFALREKIDLAIECMKHNGVIAELYEKWFDMAPDAKSASVVIYPGLGVPGMPGYDPKPHQLNCK
jgi:polar amino acid transport system substrate-binding protein